MAGTDPIQWSRWGRNDKPCGALDISQEDSMCREGAKVSQLLAKSAAGVQSPEAAKRGRLRGSKLSSAVCIAVAPADACCALRCASACSSGCLGTRWREGKDCAHQELQSSHAAA